MTCFPNCHVVTALPVGPGASGVVPVSLADNSDIFVATELRGSLLLVNRTLTMALIVKISKRSPFPRSATTFCEITQKHFDGLSTISIYYSERPGGCDLLAALRLPPVARR